MIRIVVGGQIDKENIAKVIQNLGGEKVQVTIKSDIDAAMAVKTQQADYYIGACLTGGGGALAMAIALLGLSRCATLSMPGNIRSDEEIQQEIRAGKKAFGFTGQHAAQVLPVVMGELLKQV